MNDGVIGRRIRWLVKIKSPAILVPLGLGLLFGLLLILFRPPEDMLSSVPRSSLYLDRQGIPLRLTLAEDQQYRLILPLDQFPRELKQSVMLYEDRYFYIHPGINPWSLLRAFWETYVVKSRSMGGSTLTMQTARMLYGLDSSHLAGKIRQIFTALYLELYYTKGEILEAYLNLVPCGHNITGFPAAAMFYFGKQPHELNLTEILTLTVLPQDPNSRAPDRGGESREQQQAKERLARLWVNRYPQFREDGELLMAPLRVEGDRPFRAPHYVQWLINHDLTGVVYGTLDWQLQRKTEQLLQSYLDRQSSKGVRNASIMILRRDTMELLVHIGSADYFDHGISGQVDGTDARRSPGSTLKPFIYALAFDQGIIHAQTLLKDAPISFSEYSPDNYLNDFAGVIPAWDALNSSRNIPAVELASQLHDPDLYDLVSRLEPPGLEERDHYGLSIVLGGLELTMEELVRLYSALGNRGMEQPLRRTLNQPYGQGQTLFSPQAAYMVLDILRDNPLPASTVAPRGSMAYKTGTSIGFRDCWSVGLWGDYVLAVWIGNFDGRENHHFLGRSLAAPLLFEISHLLEEQGELSQRWPPYHPLGLGEVDLCAVSGGMALDICPQLKKGWFIPGVSPIDRCDIHREIYLTVQGLRTTRNAGDHHRTEVWEIWPGDVLDLFAQAGLPRKPLPPFAHELRRHSTQGRPPVILLPQHNVGYQVFLQGRQPIPFQAVGEGDAEKLFWFADNRYLAVSEPGELLELELAPGEYNLRVVDNLGRASGGRLLLVEQLAY